MAAANTADSRMYAPALAENMGRYESLFRYKSRGRR